MENENTDKISLILSILIPISVILTFIFDNLYFLFYTYFFLLTTISILIVNNSFEIPENSLLNIGLANIVTLLRGYVFVVFLIVRDFFHPIVFSISLILILLLDTVDGNIARLRGKETRIGEILDIEIDALFTLLMIAMLVFENYLQLWIVSIGLLRYLYTIFLQIINIDLNPPRRSFLSRIVSVCFNVSLIINWAVHYVFVEYMTYILGVGVFTTFIKDFYYRIK